MSSGSAAVWSGLAATLVSTGREIASLEASGLIEVGGHTATHAWLPGLTPEGQLEEIASGKRALDELLGRPTESFAYPHGEFEPVTANLVRTLGFRRACAGMRGAVSAGSPVYAIPRIHVEDLSGAEFGRLLDRWLRPSRAASKTPAVVSRGLAASRRRAIPGATAVASALTRVRRPCPRPSATSTARRRAIGSAFEQGRARAGKRQHSALVRDGPFEDSALIERQIVAPSRLRKRRQTALDVGFALRAEAPCAQPIAGERLVDEPDSGAEP